MDDNAHAVKRTVTVCGCLSVSITQPQEMNRPNTKDIAFFLQIVLAREGTPLGRPVRRAVHGGFCLYLGICPLVEYQPQLPN